MKSRLVFRPVPCELVDTGRALPLPDSVARAVAAHWAKLMAEGKPYTNGKLYAVESVSRGPEGLRFFMAESNFAHYLYALSLGEDCSVPCRSVAIDALPITADDYYVLGRMDANTSFPNKVKFIGGAVDSADRIDGRFDPSRTLTRELSEETGFTKVLFDGEAAALPLLILARKGLITLNFLYTVRLTLDRETLYRRFCAFNDAQKKTGAQELDDLVFLSRDMQALRTFTVQRPYAAISYLYDTFRVLSGEDEPVDLALALLGR
jgi:8-oxo-dGTP pyrophosphatase MutT (NUDIX family)